MTSIMGSASITYSFPWETRSHPWHGDVNLIPSPCLMLSWFLTWMALLSAGWCMCQCQPASWSYLRSDAQLRWLGIEYLVVHKLLLIVTLLQQGEEVDHIWVISIELVAGPVEAKDKSTLLLTLFRTWWDDRASVLGVKAILLADFRRRAIPGSTRFRWRRTKFCRSWWSRIVSISCDWHPGRRFG